MHQTQLIIPYKPLHILLQADDPELEAIRQRRMAEMMAQQGGGGKVGNPGIQYILYQSNGRDDI